jgi:hypothetical protein
MHVIVNNIYCIDFFLTLAGLYKGEILVFMLQLGGLYTCKACSGTWKLFTELQFAPRRKRAVKTLIQLAAD